MTRAAATGQPLVAVVLDFGSASPLDILAAARGVCGVVFVCDRDLPYVQDRLADLETFGTICDITGLAGEQAADRVRASGAAGITTFSDYQITRTAALASGAGLTYHSSGTATALTDKLTQRALLAAAGLEATRSQAVTSLADLGPALARVGLPAVLKPRTGAGGARTARADTEIGAATLLADFLAAPPGRAEFVVEELLAGDPSVAGPEWGDYVSAESVTVAGVTHHIEVTGKFALTEPFRETGYFVPSTLTAPWRTQVLTLAGAAISALGVTCGATHVETKLTPDGPKIIEVNGRLGGYVGDIVRRARGFDLVRATLQAALGQPPGPPPDGYRRHAFQYFVMPPVDAVALRRLDGVDELRRAPGIQLVEVLRKPGDPLDWRLGTLSYLAIVYGTGGDHQDILERTDLVKRTLHIEYEWARVSL